MKDTAPLGTVPRLTTARLTLREFRVTEFDAFAANSADPAASEYVPPTPDRRAAWRAFAASMGFWMLQGAGWWAVALRETDEVVGTVGAFFRETSPELEIGWKLYRHFWGRGFATEAAAAALTYAFAHHEVPRAIAHISAGNVASVRVSEKIGMRYDTDVDFYGEVIGRYVIDKRSRTP